MRYTLVFAMLLGCHGGLRRYVPNPSALEPRYVDRTRVTADIGAGRESAWYRRDAVARALGRRFERDVGMLPVARAFFAPFHFPPDHAQSTGAADTAVLTVEVTDKAIAARDVRAPADLVYAARAWITIGDGDPIWRTRVRCAAPLGSVDHALVGPWLAPATLREGFVDLAGACGQRLADRIARRVSGAG